MTVSDAIVRALAEDWDGSEQPPGATQKLYVTDSYAEGIHSRTEMPLEELTDERRAHLIHVFSAVGGGSEIGIGWPSKWHVLLSQPVALRLAWFILWTWWAKGTWCGLKRVIYYRALHRVVARLKQEGKHHGANQ